MLCRGKCVCCVGGGVCAVWGEVCVMCRGRCSDYTPCNRDECTAHIVYSGSYAHLCFISCVGGL